MKSTIMDRLALCAMATMLCGLMGCGTGPGGAGSGGTGIGTATGHISGKVIGGQQPIAGAFINLYAVSTDSLRAESRPLMFGNVQTDANGNFDITGKYTCPFNDGLVYISAAQGDPGLGNGSNGAISLIAALGSCNTLQANAATTFTDINEVTTVAAVYALGGFMADARHVGAPPALAAGMANAFQMATVLANTTNGTAPGPALAGNATMSVAELYTVADILAACINSDGSTDAGTPCGMLFTNTTIPGLGFSPQDTLTAAVNMLANPAKNVAALYGLSSPTAPFQPALASAPKDWTMALHYTGGGLKTPYGIAIDATGNAWVANESGNSITKFAIGGTLLSSTAGFTGNGNIQGAQAIAIDATGKAWVANTAGNSVVVLNADGTLAGNYTSGGIDGPTSIALDSAGNAWIANFTGSSLTVLNNSGSPIDSSPLTGGGVLNLPATVALDASGNAWVANTGTRTLMKFANAGTVISSGSGYTDGSLLEPLGIDFDSTGDAWIASNGLNTLNSLTQSGTASISAPVSGLNSPVGIALDGANSVWMTNAVPAGSLAIVAAGSSAVTLYGTLNKPMAVAVDGSGNLWTANAADNSVSEFIGMATPVTTPSFTKAGP